MVIKKEIVYPIFIECTQYCESKFWQQIFEDLAYGKCPYGTYIHKNYFACNFKGKEFSFKFEGSEAKIIFDNLFNFLKNKLGLLSEEERNNKILNYLKNENEIYENKLEKWSSIKKKSLKDSLIENFIINSKKRFKLNDKQIKSLHKIINLGLIFKTISHKDISLKEGKINEINGIEFSDKNFKITKDLITSEELEVNGENEEIPKLSDIYKKMSFK